MGDPRTLLLVGGGRWGRVHASNLIKLLGTGDRLIWASTHNAAALAENIAALQPDGPQVVVMDLAQALEAGASAAIVVTAAETHKAVATACLERGMHVFVEKPLALTADDARAVIALAAERKRVLAIGLHLLSTSYLLRFADFVHGRKIARITISWFDPAEEVRYGEIKRTDPTHSKAHDLYPHVWAVLTALTGKRRHDVGNVAWMPGGIVEFETRSGTVPALTQLSRRADRRARIVSVQLEDGASAVLDFSHEPGTITLNGVTQNADPSWGQGGTPLMVEVRAFLDAAEGKGACPQRADECLGSVVGAEMLEEKLLGHQTEALDELIRMGRADAGDPDTADLVTSLMAPALKSQRIRFGDLDEAARTRVIEEALRARVARG